jgi:hypothetical protein
MILSHSTIWLRTCTIHFTPTCARVYTEHVGSAHVLLCGVGSAHVNENLFCVPVEQRREVYTKRSASIRDTHTTRSNGAQQRSAANPHQDQTLLSRCLVRCEAACVCTYQCLVFVLLCARCLRCAQLVDLVKFDGNARLCGVCEAGEHVEDG